MKAQIIFVLLSLALFGCTDSDVDVEAAGQLESPRIELVAQVAETLTRRDLLEGARVQPGEMIFELDDTLAIARLEEAQARIFETRSALDELLEGTRVEQLENARAQNTGAKKEYDFRVTELQRIQDLIRRELAADEELDRAQAALDLAKAELDVSAATLKELTAGPRQKTIEQAEARLQMAQAGHRIQQAMLAKHSTRAPAAGVLDEYLLELGETPAVGDVVAILLGGDQPFARVYVPANIRSQIRPGDAVTVIVDGLEKTFPGQIRWISREAAFTPYFALTEHDRDRLSYEAKIDLSVASERLPDGVPVTVQFAGLN